MPRALLLFAITAALSAASTACFDFSRPFQKPVPKSGQKIFAFDYTEVTELTVAKIDPSSGQSWSAELVRDGERKDSPWLIRSYTGGALLDRLADRNFALHLLDTLSTVQAGEAPPRGPPESFGLKPPRFALRWKTAQQQFELGIGNPIEGGRAYALLDEEVLTIRGAALGMLEHLGSFEALRHRRLLTATADDVDEMTFFRGGKQVLYAQRENHFWVDAKHQRLKVPAGTILDTLAHLRVTAFVDDSERSDALASRIRQEPLIKVHLSGRILSPAIELSFRVDGGKLWAHESRRNHVFELPLEALSHLQTLPH